MQAAAAAMRSSGRLLRTSLTAAVQSEASVAGRMVPRHSSASSRINPVANFSASAGQEAKNLKNRPLSPFLSQKRPEKSSIMSIGERMVLITVGLVLIPAPEIAKMSHFLY